MDLIQAIVYGVIQGVTEWLPISSTAHLRIVPALLRWPDPGAAFTAVVQLGTVLAALLYFGRDLQIALLGWTRSFKRGDARNTREAKVGWAIFVGTIPIVVLGLILQRRIETDFRSLYVIAFSLIFMGIVMLIAERVATRRRSFEDVQVKDGVIVGLWQAASLVPGMSRSGSTISGALFSGFDRPAAARLSFLLSIPSVLGAGLKEAYSERAALYGQNLMPLVVATVVSFAVGFATIALLMRFLQTHSTNYFSGYRVVLGIVLLGLLQADVLSPLPGP